MDAIGGFIVVATVLSAYFFPAIVAAVRGHHNTASIAVVNFFFGWTFIGWVVALAMAVSRVERATSPPPARRRRIR